MKPRGMIFAFLLFAAPGCAAGGKAVQHSVKVAGVEYVARVTGSPMEGETMLSPNNTTEDWDVAGTDLGIVWEMERGRYGIFFGDTYGRAFVPGRDDPGLLGDNWRCNVLAFSSDADLSDGMTIDQMTSGSDGKAMELLPAGKDRSGSGDWTSIPTAAIRANGVDYVHYFNMKNWVGWVTNHSGLYRSTDNGRSWTRCEGVYFDADSNFGQAGYFKKEGYVYMVGTETGRQSRPRLARFREEDVENMALYEYWNRHERRWIAGDETKATDMLDDTVGELSIAYNTKFDRWLIAYFCAHRYEISLRSADDITGKWSAPQTLASGREHPRLYGSFIHPASLDSDELYFLMSLWRPYNVFLMKAKLKYK